MYSKLVTDLGPEHTSYLLQALANESEWIALNMQGPGDKAREHVAEMLVDEDAPEDMPDDFAGGIVKVLTDQTSWGEFLGLVCLAYDKLTDEERQRVLPALKNSVKYAAEHGVDH